MSVSFPPKVPLSSHLTKIKELKDSDLKGLDHYLDQFFRLTLGFFPDDNYELRESDKKIYSIYRSIFDAKQGQELEAYQSLISYLESVINETIWLTANGDYPNKFLLGANLEDADLSGADLRGANLREANLREANLDRANLDRANLEDADLDRVHLERAKLTGAGLRKANLDRADLTRANLEGANLSGAMLREADLRGANLEDADLRGADLRGAKLEVANLRGANIEGSHFRFRQAQKVLSDKDLPPNIFVDAVGIDYNLEAAIRYLDLMQDRPLDKQTMKYIAKNLLGPEAENLNEVSLEDTYKNLINTTGSKKEYIKSLRAALAAKLMIDKLVDEFSPSDQKKFKTNLEDILIPTEKRVVKNFTERLSKSSVYDFSNITDGVLPIFRYLLLPKLYQDKGQEFCKNLSPTELDTFIRDNSLVLIKWLNSIHNGNVNLSNLLKWSNDLHRSRNNFDGMLTQYLPKTGWQALVNQPIEIEGDIQIRNLTSFEEFQKITEVTGLCIGNSDIYSSKAEAGTTHFFAVYKGKTPLSVLDFQIEEMADPKDTQADIHLPIFVKKSGEEEAEYSGKVLRKNNHEGWVEDGRIPSPDAQRAYTEFGNKLRQGDIVVNLNENSYGKIEKDIKAEEVSAFEKALALNFNPKLNFNPEAQEEDPVEFVGKLAWDIFSGNTKRSIKREVNGQIVSTNIPNIWNNTTPAVPVIPKGLEQKEFLAI